MSKDNYSGTVRVEFDGNNPRDRKAIDNLNHRSKTFKEKLNINLTRNQLMRSVFKDTLKNEEGKNA